MTAKQPHHATRSTFLLRAGGHPHMRLLVEREHDRVLGRVDVEADDVRELGGERGVVGALEGAHAVRLQVVRGPDPLHRAQPDPAVSAIARPVQWVTSPGGSAQVKATTRCTVASPSGALPGLRVASRSRPSTPASAKRRCQRHTAGRPTLARRATSATGSRSADAKMIRARATCFWARLRSATSPPNEHDPGRDPRSRQRVPCACMPRLASM